MTTTHSGVDSEATALSTDEATEALLSRWTDAAKPSDRDGGANTPDPRDETSRDEVEEEDNESDDDLDLDTDEEQDDDEQDEGDEADDQEADEADEPTEASDDAVVRIKVDGEDRTVPVKDLKRLFGQEQALTRKSQEVAQARKAAESEGERFTVAAGKLMERAQERFKPYANIDWQIAAKTLDNDEFVALRQEAQAAYEDLKFLNEELEGAHKATQEARIAEVHEAAKEAVAVLERDIPGWDQKIYNEVIDYAVSNGLDRAAVSQVVEPNLIKLIHKAKAFDEAKARAAAKRKAIPASKRTMKSKTRPQRPLGKLGDQAAIQRLSKTGSADDAVAALLARWETSGND